MEYIRGFDHDRASRLLLIFSLIAMCLIHVDCQSGRRCSSQIECGDERHVRCENGLCQCQPYHVEINGSCLAGSLLGFACQVDNQCSVKVPHSGCVQGLCACSKGYTAFRRHTCLGPSTLSSICYTSSQCELSDKNSYCKYIIPKVFGRCHCKPGSQIHSGRCTRLRAQLGHPCLTTLDCLDVSNSLCLPRDGSTYVCACNYRSTPALDGTRCIPTLKGVPETPVTLGQNCVSSSQCQSVDPHTECVGGVCDCQVKHSFCSARDVGCFNDTFQCQSTGRCVSWYFVCDGHDNCGDNSDEEGCVGGERRHCPPLAVPCDDGGCVSRSALCDGKKQCRDGSDELRCGEGNCPQGTFRCNDGTCLPEYEFCNAIISCPDGSDEPRRHCQHGTSRTPTESCPFWCDNGFCRSTAVLCTGLNGCGDNSDEKRCRVCRCPAPPKT